MNTEEMDKDLLDKYNKIKKDNPKQYESVL